MTQSPCKDTVILNQWHVISALEDIPAAGTRTTLLQEVLTIASTGDGFSVTDSTGRNLPVLVAYGYLWTSLGAPEGGLFPIPEYAEADRRRMNAASVGVHVSAPRAVENFLDMGHFPFVHTDILGAQPHTEVEEYDVEISVARDEILATRCRFFQPIAAAASAAGAMVDYAYRVPHPYCSVLYKSSPLHPDRMDVIALFLQPIDQEHVRAHLMLCLLDEENEDKAIRRFQQIIFGQDKPILENQYPKRLPLDPRAETPIRADKSAVAYRRWLSQKGVSYGTIPASH